MWLVRSRRISVCNKLFYYYRCCWWIQFAGLHYFLNLIQERTKCASDLLILCAFMDSFCLKQLCFHFICVFGPVSSPLILRLLDIVDFSLRNSTNFPHVKFFPFLKGLNSTTASRSSFNWGWSQCLLVLVDIWNTRRKWTNKLYCYPEFLKHITVTTLLRIFNTPDELFIITNWKLKKVVSFLMFGSFDL